MQNSQIGLEELFLEQGLIDLAYKVISFIDVQTLSSIIEVDQSQSEYFNPLQTEFAHKFNKSRSKIKKLIQIHCFVKNSLNLTDRSIYYPFYQQPHLKSISKSLQENIIITQVRNRRQKNLASHYVQLNKLFQLIKNQQLLPQQEINQLNRIITDPSLPLPTLKRQNQGIYCNSSFQLFLVSLKFPHFSCQSFSPFEQLKQKILSEEESNLKQFLQVEKQKQKSTKVYENLHLVRYMPYEITYQNFKTLILKNNCLHNLVVIIFALTDVWIEALKILICAIQDPFYKLAEMMSRYAVFRSFVIEIQDSLGFLFQSYQSLYSDTIRDSLFETSPMKPKFCFWRPALSKWFLKMNSIHYKTNDVYFLLLTKLRQQALLNKIKDINSDPLWEKAKKHQIIIRNALELNEFSGKLKQKISQNMSGSSIMEEFLSNNKDTSKCLVFEYVEYFIDLAVNQETVHWCGHSNHKLEKPFDLFNQQFHKYNTAFLKNLQNNVLGQISSKQSKNYIMELLVQIDFEFMETKNIKPIMLRPFVDDINRKGFFFQDVLLINQNLNPIIEVKDQFEQKVTQNSQKQKGEVILNYDFAERDQKLKYFNDKAKICEFIEGEQKFFFSIPPLLSPSQILIKSINTNDTTQNQDTDPDSSFQYVSENRSEAEFDLEQFEKQQQNILFQYSNKIIKKIYHFEQECEQKPFRNVESKDMQEEQTIRQQEFLVEKKSLQSTNSSSKETDQAKPNSQNNKSTKSTQHLQLLIINSQSI